MYKICDLFSSGNKAVRDFDRNILIAHHFADPSSGHFDWYAKVMDECNLDYDVFAASYYSYWHGTTDNLTAVLKGIADKYNKYVMVAETAYPYTSEDGDTFGNAVSEYSDNVTLRYPISVEGQADAITDVFQAVANVGSKGIGAFYWEPAWLGVYNIPWEQQNELWKKYGSGWATDYAAEYDASVTAVGGSAYDNQALFDFSGRPLESLDVFSRIYPQKEIPVEEYFMTGDLYPDGVINVYDLILLRKELIEQKFSPFGDINNDRQVSVADLVMMNNHVIGKEGFKVVKKGNPPKKRA
jgi:arabinogalactan endo-1,4-beta-galactosidase